MPSPRRSFLFRHLVLSSLAIWILVCIGAVVAGPIASHVSIFRPSLDGHYVQSIAAVLRAANQKQKAEDLVKEIAETLPADKGFGDFFIANDSGMVLGSSQNVSDAITIDPRFFPKEATEVATLNSEA